MSVVARQGFKYSIIGYLGFLLGTVSAIFIFPYDLEYYGKLRYILPTAQMFLSVVVFGLSYSTVKFYPETKAAGKHQNMLSLALTGVGINFLIFAAGLFLVFTLFPQYKTTELWNMKRLILPLILVLALSAVFNKYISNYKRIVVPNIFENVFPKLANFGAFSLFFFAGMPEKGTYAFFLGVFVLGLMGYALYANKLEKITPDFSLDFFKKNDFWKGFANYSFYGFLGNLGSYLALSIDSYMIGEYLGFEENGVYSTVYSIVSLISIPAMGLYNISAPIINQHFAQNTMKDLDEYHKKTSLTLFFIGLVLVSCIWVGFPYLAQFMPKNGTQLLEAEPLLWIIGSAILFELATGFNGHIISLSKYYKFNIAVMLLLALLTISLNLYFIKNTTLGIFGVAISYAVSLTLFNLTKIVFNFYKFKVFPLTIEMVYAMILGTLAITLTLLLPDFNNNFLNLIFKPGMVLVMFAVGNHFLKIFPLENYVNMKFIKSIFKF